jgi:hypothetical protein
MKELGESFANNSSRESEKLVTCMQMFPILT